MMMMMILKEVNGLEVMVWREEEEMNEPGDGISIPDGSFGPMGDAVRGSFVTSGVKYDSPRLRYWGPEGENYDERPIEGMFKYVWDGKEAIRRGKENEKGSEEDLEGKVLMYELKSGESLEDAVRLFNESKIAAFVSVIRSFTEYPGNGNWIRDGSYPGQKFPIFEISSKTNKTLAKWNSNSTYGYTIARIHNEKNDWEKTFQVGVPIVAFYILIANGIISIIAAYKLTLTIVENGVRQITLPQCVFGMGLIASILRIIFASSDPFGVWGSTSFLFQQLLMNISIPLTICSLLLIALYWDEMVSKSKSFQSSKRNNMPKSKSSNSNRNWKIPFFIFYAIVQSIEIVSSSLRGNYISLVAIIFITGAIYVFTVLGINIFFIVSRVRLEKIFKELNRSLGQKKKEEKLRLASNHFIAIVVASFVWVIFLILAAANFIWTPIGFPIGWAIYFISLDIIQIGQILMIKAPQRPLKWFFCGLCHPNPSDLFIDVNQSQSSSSKIMSITSSKL